MLSSTELKKATLFKSLKIASATPTEVYKFMLRGSTTNIATVPAEIRAFKNLQLLDLSGCPLRGLPDWIGDFPNLQSLKISETRREWAIEEGLNPEAIEKLYSDLVKHFIEEEIKHWKNNG